MTNIFLYEDFRVFLNDEFQRRLMRNSKYSLRAYARDIDISFSRLSETLSSQVGMSVDSAHKIATRLKMSDLEREYFLNLILSKHARTAGARKKAAQVVAQYKTKRIFSLLRENHVGILSKWYYPALIELLTIEKVPVVPDIAGALKIPPEEVLAAALHLSEQGFIERGENGIWTKTTAFLKIESPTPSALIRDYHKTVLRQASEAIEEQPIDQRKYLTTFFQMRKGSIAEARKELEEFNEAFIKKYTAEQNAEVVYGFSLQMFKVEQHGGQ